MKNDICASSGTLLTKKDMDNQSPLNITICICTRKRQEGLANLLKSFEAMTLPADVIVRTVVVENDTENFSEALVRSFAAESRIRTDYYLETKQGLVFARNRSVKEAGNCDFCCFTDDDETVCTGWLEELLKCQREFDADGVAGPTYPVFTRTLPGYISDFHQPETHPYGTIIESAYTGCLLLRKSFLDRIPGPFDERLNMTGGEDINLTYFISKLGGVIRFNPEARAYETFSRSRENVGYILKRTYRNSNTGLYARSLRGTQYYKIKNLPRLLLRLGNGLLTFIPLLIFGGSNKLKGLIKIVNATGGLHFMLGRQNKFYK